jgi:hypothetical protein
MKKFLYSALAVAIIGITSCNKTETKTETTETETKTETTVAEGKSYGEKITPDGAIAAADLKAQMAGKDTMSVKIKGEISEVCQKKGCWVTITMPSGEPMRVMFGEDAYFVPKDVAGKTAIMEGTAMKEVISVDEQRHYLEDAGKPKAEIEAITKPDTTLTFDAKGIIIL